MTSLAEFIYSELLRPAPLKRVANSIILSILPKTVRLGPAIVHLNPADPVVSGALTLRVFERQEIAFFLQACRSGMTVIDIGANVGVYTALAMHCAGPNGKVVAIEPHAESRQFLAKTIDANAERLLSHARPHVFDCAAADHDGIGRLFLNPDNKADNRLYRSDATRNIQSSPVQFRTVDGMLAELGIEKIDILKIDVQGSEFSAISGAAKTIKNSKGMILLTEFWPDGIRQASGRDPQCYLDLLRELGLNLYELKRGTLAPITPDLIERLTGRRYTNLVGTSMATPHLDCSTNAA
jgi:FkbM family methyltransferase